MELKITPKVSRRYWAAILIASMSGCNFGDFFPDILKVNSGVCLLILCALFVAIVLADRMSRYGSEAFYWLAILVVRAAATNIADVSISKAGLGYLTTSVGLAALLSVLVAVYRTAGAKPSTGGLPPTNGFYWLTMLTAGALGTVIGDGVGHAFGPVQIGVPISAAMATGAMALILGARTGFKWTTAVAYWVAVVMVRWWGTNFGDILAFFITLWGSMAVTSATLALILYVWHERLPNLAELQESR